ncbi:DMT family transporter [Patescibacteria group bacterium]|nr:DMT family transporter [Patescibacteria group bacterium]
MMPKFSRMSGLKLAFITAIISGFAVFINKFGVVLWANSSAYTTAKNVVAAIFLTALILFFKKQAELRRLSKKQWFKLLLIGFIGGSVPFLLFFKSLTMVSAAEAAFIHKTLFIWVAILAVPFLKEKLKPMQFIALGILLIGVYLFGAPAQWSFGAGSAMVLGATLFWAAESIIAKKILAEVSASTVAWARMFFGSLFLISWLVFSGQISTIIPSSLSQGIWALVVGLVLFGYVTSWYSALQKAPATEVSSVLVLAAPITAILDGIIAKHAFPMQIIIPFLVMLLGALLITKQFAYLYSRLVKKTNHLPV